MGIIINPDTWLFHWIVNKKERNLRIADLLDDISKDAMKIAKIWDKVLTTLDSKGEVSAESNKLWKELIIRKNIPHIQGWIDSKLESFYQNISVVLGRDHKDELELVLVAISKILLNRNLTKKLVENEIKKLNKKVYLVDDRTAISLEISDSIKIMYKEAAALHVQAKLFRAKI